MPDLDDAADALQRAHGVAIARTPSGVCRMTRGNAAGHVRKP